MPPASAGCAGPPARARRGAAAEGRTLGCPAVGSQPQSCAPPPPPLKLEDQEGPQLPSDQLLCSRRSLEYPFCLGGVEGKASPPQHLVLQQGRTWLEKGRHAAEAPRGRSHRPRVGQKQMEPVGVEGRGALVPQSGRRCSPCPSPLQRLHRACGERQRQRVPQPPQGDGEAVQGRCQRTQPEKLPQKERF